MRIAMLGHKRIPSREGGVEIVVEELSKRMVEQGHEVTCYNRKGHHVSGKQFDRQKEDYYLGIRMKEVCTLNVKGLAAMSASFFAAIRCAFGKYDVVHFHAEGPCAMLWLPKLFGKRCVATIHGLDHQRAKWGRFAKWYIMLGEKCAVKYADEIIVLSHNVQEYFKKQYGRETKFIPNGVLKAVCKYPEHITAQYNLYGEDYYLYLARIVPEKGLRYLINAYKCVDSDRKLIIAGGASDSSAYLEEMKKLAKNDERIQFTGFVEGTLLEELYSNAYVYVLPSDLEGMPLSLLEAMSYGNCCVVSSIRECTEVVEDKAIIFERGNVDKLQYQLQKLDYDKLLVQRYKDEAAEFICNKYNWDDVVRKTLELYGEKNESIDG